jgi:putative resolvase
MQKSIKLKQYAKDHNICYMTARRWFSSGLIEGAYRTETGSIFVKVGEAPLPKNEQVVLYCRVSNQSRKAELEYQVQRCVSFANSNGYVVAKIYKEVASGMNDNRREFWKMLDANPTTIIVENKDRLTRFGFNYLSKLLNGKCNIIVMNPTDNDEQDLIRDLVSVVTSFCCRLYGLRRTKNKVKQIKELVGLV